MLGEHSQERGCLAILLGWTKTAQEMVGGRRSQPWQGQQEHVMGMAVPLLSPKSCCGDLNQLLLVQLAQRHPRQSLPGGVPKEPLYSFLQPLPVRSIPWEGQWGQRSHVPHVPSKVGTWGRAPCSTWGQPHIMGLGTSS